MFAAKPPSAHCYYAAVFAHPTVCLSVCHVRVSKWKLLQNWCERFSGQECQFSAQKVEEQGHRTSKTCRERRTSHVSVYEPAQAQQAQRLASVNVDFQVTI